MKKLKNLISTYKDFPQKGINFKDVLGILQDPDIFKELIQEMSASNIIRKSEAIISIDARGFIFGSAIALQSSKPMIVARKPGKLPGKILEEEYILEYGKNSLAIQENALNNYDSYSIVDDLLATGGTVSCVANILKNKNKKISGLVTVVELTELKGRLKFDFPVESSICFWMKYFSGTDIK